MVELQAKFKGKVLVLGIGNSLKQDDGAGPELIRKLKAESRPRPEGPRSEGEQKAESGKQKTVLLDAGVAPENYTGKIKQIKPDTLVIVDAIDFGERPGAIRVFEANQIQTQSLSTHNVSLKTLVGFLKADLPGLNVLVVGIQPQQVNFGEGLSPEVKKAVNELCTSLV